MEESDVKHDDRYELGSFSFLKSGWWLLHAIAIVAVFYLGYLFGGSLFR